MLLGQLYYYEKVLENLTFPLTPEKLAQLDLPGIKYISPDSFRGLKDGELAAQIRDIFIQAYSKLLEEEEMYTAHQLWRRLTGPLNIEYEFESKTPFQEKINSWQKGLHDSYTLHELIDEGKLTGDPNDFCIYFGLRVLYKFSRLKSETIHNFNFSDLLNELEGYEPTSELTDKPTIAVICNDNLAPLFANLNCECITRTNNFSLILNELNEIINTEPTIQLILVEGFQTDELVKYLKKGIVKNLVITQIHITHTTNPSRKDAFFDDLVQSTLGVKLV